MKCKWSFHRMHQRAAEFLSKCELFNTCCFIRVAQSHILHTRACGLDWLPIVCIIYVLACMPPLSRSMPSLRLLDLLLSFSVNMIVLSKLAQMLNHPWRGSAPASTRNTGHAPLLHRDHFIVKVSTVLYMHGKSSILLCTDSGSDCWAGSDAV